MDTGFIVFNERNYPNLTALFRRLGVAIKASDMTYALTVRDGWLEWGAKNLDTIFGQRRNLMRPRFRPTPDRRRAPRRPADVTPSP